MKLSDFQGLPNTLAAHVGPVAVPSTAGGVLLTSLFTLHEATRFVLISAETADVRLTDTGTAPTATLGYSIPATTPPCIVELSREQALTAKVIQAAAGATLQIGQYVG